MKRRNYFLLLRKSNDWSARSHNNISGLGGLSLSELLPCDLARYKTGSECQF